MKLLLAIGALVFGYIVKQAIKFWKIAGSWRGKKEHDENSYS